MSLQWLKPRGICRIEKIKELESKIGITFPPQYVELVTKFNGAHPSKKLFNSLDRKDCVFEELINWDESRKANIFFWIDLLKPCNVVPFGKDPFGNCICFDFSQKLGPGIVFWDHETNRVYKISESFAQFLNSLRE